MESNWCFRSSPIPSWSLLATLLTALAFPAALVLVAYPAATLFEANRWWLINESVLTWRWLLTGALIAPLSWLVWPSLLPKRQSAKIRVEQRRIIVRRPGGDWVIPTRDLARIWVSSGGLRLSYLPSSDLPEVIIALPLANPTLWQDIAAHRRTR